MKIENLTNFDEKYLESAVAGIIKTLKRSKSEDLLETRGDVVTLTFSLAKVPPGVRPKPLGITIPHSLYLNSDTNVCLVVRDPQRKWKDIMAAQWKPEEMGGLSQPKIIGLTKLKKNYRTMASRRQLMRSYDIFLCDTHIANQMPRILGRTFIDAGKLPIDVKVKETNFLAPFKTRLAQSFLRLRTGTSVSVKIGYANDTSKSIIQNASCVINAVAKFFDPPEEELVSTPFSVFRDNQLQYIHVTATNCPALPVYIHPSISSAVADIIKRPNERITEDDAALPAKKRKVSTKC